jgi:hypothetical protein
MSLHTKVSGVWKEVGETFVKVSGVWKPCGDVLAKVGGVWKSILYASGSQTFTSSSTLTIPAGVYSLTVDIQSAGGGGGFGGDVMDYGASGSGGSAGGRITGSIAVVPYQTCTITVGTGGNTGTTYTANGSRTYGQSGGLSRIVVNGNTLTANGGGAGGNACGFNKAPFVATSQAGGSCSATTSTGLTFTTGSTGNNGEAGTNGYSSGEGGLGANSAVGTASTTKMNGVNYGSLDGNNNASAAATTGYGAGGGGGGWRDRNASTRGYGGKGGNGRVILSW